MTTVVNTNRWPGSRALATSLDADVAELQISPGVGQRQATFTFTLVNGVSGQRLGEIHPIRQPAQIDHDVNRTIKRSMRLAISSSEVADIDPVQDRILPAMTVAGVTYPLGRFMFTDDTRLLSTGGQQATQTLLDEMFRIDQQLENGFASTAPVDQAVRALLTGFQLVGTRIEATQFASLGGWTAGTTRGQVLEALSILGDYETPWMANDGFFSMVRTIDPDKVPATFDLDSGHRVIRDSPGQSSDLLTAPNRFVVVANSANAAEQAITGIYDVPADAPHSITNRGFVVPAVYGLQVTSTAQAKAIAQGIGLRSTVFERTDLETVPDPRHDSYDVIHWQGRNWLELAWSMTLEEGASMRHTLRRALRT